MTQQAPAQPEKPRRKGHRRGAQALSATGRALGGPKPQAKPGPVRACVICRTAAAAHGLLQLADRTPGPPGSKHRKHRYVCVARACLLALVERASKGAPAFAPAVGLKTFEALAIRRLTETLGLARRQGDLILGAGRVLELRARDRAAPEDAWDEDDERDGDGVGGEEGDDDDEDEDEHASNHQAGHDRPNRQAADDASSRFGAAPGRAAAAHRAGAQDAARAPGSADPAGPTEAASAAMRVEQWVARAGAQGLTVCARDAAPRTRRNLGPEALPCPLTAAEMGQAAGGAPVAAAAIVAGRLAFQAAYWLQIWYEARVADHTRVDHSLRWRDE